ncbi:hypothetical protein RQP46_002098 [Phenoliferia psychrophenolica]
MAVKAALTKKRPSSALDSKTNEPEAKVQKLHSMFAKPERGFTWRSQTGPCRHGFFPTPRTPSSPSIPPPPSSKLAVFDLDGCLIKTKYGAFPPASSTDWKWWHPTKVTKKLKELYDDGFAIVILTNQGWRGKESKALTDFEVKVPEIAQALDVPFTLFAAASQTDEVYRKPATGMLDLYIQKYNAGIVPDLKESFFVGDAAGRPNDHSDSDLMMARNAGLPFFTPEEFFK